MLASQAQSLLLLVDFQERLAPAIRNHEQTIVNAATLVHAARRLDVPILASEQNPSRLGTTVPALAGLFPKNVVHPKMHFSCCAEAAWIELIEHSDRRQIVVAGMETHVCVLQTSIDLATAGYDVFVVADASSSRQEENHRLGLERMRFAGVNIVTMEMVVFEWLHRAGTQEFRDLLPRIK